MERQERGQMVPIGSLFNGDGTSLSTFLRGPRSMRWRTRRTEHFPFAWQGRVWRPFGDLKIVRIFWATVLYIASRGYPGSGSDSRWIPSTQDGIWEWILVRAALIRVDPRSSGSKSRSGYMYVYAMTEWQWFRIASTGCWNSAREVLGKLNNTRSNHATPWLTSQAPPRTAMDRHVREVRISRHSRAI